MPSDLDKGRKVKIPLMCIIIIEYCTQFYSKCKGLFSFVYLFLFILILVTIFQDLGYQVERSFVNIFLQFQSKEQGFTDLCSV